MTNHMETAHALRGRTDVHFNCCQSVLVSFAADLGLTEEQAFALGSNFGAGMRMGSACGALTGALMALGLMGNNFLGPVILMVVATTIVTPILLKFVFRWGPANTPPVEKGFSETYAQLGALRSGIGVKEMAEKAQQAAAQQKK